MSKNTKQKFIIGAGLIAGTFVVLDILGKSSKEKDAKNIDDGNQYLNKDKNDIDISKQKKNFYIAYGKRIVDKTLSFTGLVILAPVYAALSLAIVIDDPGPVFFTQKRVGKDKHFFKLHKFRSMKMCTPHDIPTHMLLNPDQYITRIGKFLRKSSLDELPQIWDIFVGNMSIIGPRPALWNQDDLIAERDKYGANNVMPGLTGWAQINGRDELEIAAKAKLDGDYVFDVCKSSKEGFTKDLKCFFGTIKSVSKADGIVEGGTGKLNKVNHELGNKYDEFGENYKVDNVNVNIISEKQYVPNNRNLINVLIAGKGSYIGTKVKEYLSNDERYIVTELDLLTKDWEKFDFSGFDVVYQVAGIAHKKETSENAQLYYEVNRDLAFSVATAAKKAGVKRFIYMSSMSVYGLETSDMMINLLTPENPNTNYGMSKLQAEQKLSELEDDNFIISYLRPPMVYGENAPGNLEKLFSLVRKVHMFPTLTNERSSIYIMNLCAGIKEVIEKGYYGVVIMQDGKYRCTVDIIKCKMADEGVPVKYLDILNPFIKTMIGHSILVSKAFGNLKYKMKQ